ncbi:hypothetical protein TNCV_4152731 [Trichonephila clavipes]|nr:hypothetical protein TNCV_4152731 [Trichonephila clavipes]
MASKRKRNVLNTDLDCLKKRETAEEYGFQMQDSYGVIRTTIRVLSYSTTAVQENQRPCSETTKVYNGTAKRK